MKYQFDVLRCTLSHLFFLSFFCVCSVLADSAKVRPLFVRVLLEEQKNAQDVSWTACSDSGFVVTESGTSRKKIKSSNSQIHISVKNNFFHLNGKKFLKKRFILFPKDGLIGLKEKFYKGWRTKSKSV